MPTSKETRQARHEHADAPRTKRGTPHPRSGKMGDQSFTQVPGKGLVHLVKGELGWNEMSISTGDFSKGRPSSTVISSGRAIVGTESSSTSLEKIIDSAATPGNGGQYGTLPSGHVNLIYDGGGGNTEATLYNIKSANANLTIEDDEDGSGNSFLLFTAADQSVSLHRFDVLYAVDTTNATTTYTNASGSNGIIFQDTEETTWTIGSLANNKIPVSVDIDLPTMYTHPTSAGNKHIPTGGSPNQFLKYSSSGTAVWATPSYTTNTNYYLDGITKSGNTLTFSVSGGASYDETYTFGSNAFNSTAFLTAISSTLATDESASPPRVSILDDGSTVKALEEGTGISIEESATAGGDTVKISSTVDTSGLLTNGIVTIEDSSDDTQNADGGDILKFAEDSTSTFGWAVTKASNTITITPELSGLNNGNWNTAYGWGNHGSAGYITGNQTITLSGDATGSGTTGITVVVANDSHTHDTRYYTESEMNTSLALKANLSSPTFTGTVTCEVIRLSSQTDVSATSTGHGLQIGPTNGYNFAIDNNELIARNNGAIATLHLSPDGGPTSGSYDNISVTMNHNVSGGRINIYENGDIDCLNLKARADVWAYTSSDVSLKDNRKLIESPLDIISKIGGYSFDWNSKAASHLKGHDYGVMANEIESVMPELVTTREDGIKAVRYDGIIPLLIEAIKELKEELDGIRKL